jgi:hypothetical protein
VDLVLEGYVWRRRVEEHKERGNALFAEGKYEESVVAYTAGIASCSAQGALSLRLRAVLFGNCSACLLATGRAEDALRHALAAISADPGYEKGWLRLGAAYEALGRRRFALRAYGKVRSNAVAAKRSAELNAPPVVITEEGLSGVPKGSLYLDPSDAFPKPTKFFKRAFLPGEPLMKGEARLETFDYAVRSFMADIAKDVEFDVDDEMQRRYVWTHKGVEQNVLWLDVIGIFLSLYNVVEDGRSGKVSHNAFAIPVLLVAVWTGKGDPPKEQEPAAKVCSDVARVRAMLLRNATLLSDATKRGIPVPPGFVLSVMTHVAAPELDYSILEGCSAPDCKVERASFRCGRCYLARYCGEEHMKAHWREHKKSCVTLQQRAPAVTFDCSEAYRIYRDKRRGWDRFVVPWTFPGVVVVKVQLARELDSVTISDAHGVLSLSNFNVSMRDRKKFGKLKESLLQLRTVSPEDALGESDAFGYFDADVSVENRLVIYLDRAWKCTW